MDSAEAAALRNQVDAQASTIVELRQDVTAAEERRQQGREELMKMMSELLVLKKASDTEGESGGSGEAAVGAAGQAAAPPNPPEQIGSDGSQGSVAAEAETNSFQLGGRGPAGGFAPHGESSFTHGNGGAPRRVSTVMKALKVPHLTEGGDFVFFMKDVMLYAKLNKFDSVFTSDPYVNVGNDYNTRESLLSAGISSETFEKQMEAWAFWSQALKSNTNRAIFHRCESPREVWDELQEWHGPKTNAQKLTLQQQMFDFKIGKKDPIESLFEMEALQTKIQNAGVSMDANTTYTCYMRALPETFEREKADIGAMPIYDRSKIIAIVRARHEVLKAKNGASATANVHALIAKERGRRGGRGRGRSGRGGGGRKNGGNDDDTDATEVDKNVVCHRCRGKGHYANRCNTKLCERCGGRGHNSNKCPTEVDEHAAFAMTVELPEGGYGTDEEALGYYGITPGL